MRSKILPVANICRLKAAGDALINRAPGMPGIGLVYSETGYGKTTGTAWFCIQQNGVYVRAMALWTAKTMLATIAKELTIEVSGKMNTNGFLLSAIVDVLTETRRPLFIDEADYLMDKKSLIDTLRDIHDLSTVPVVLIGEPRLEKEIRKNVRFAGRISQWVKFEGIDYRDARMIADANCEAGIADDLLERLFQAACPKNRSGEATGGAEVRRLVVGLGNIERLARKLGKNLVEDDDWPRGEDFFIGDPAAIVARQPAPKPASVRAV